MADERCGNCHFSRYALEPGGNVNLQQLQCKHDTPKVYQQITPSGMQFVVVRPGTQPNEWCGSWKAKEL